MTKKLEKEIQKINEKSKNIEEKYNNTFISQENEMKNINKKIKLIKEEINNKEKVILYFFEIFPH